MAVRIVAAIRRAIKSPVKIKPVIKYAAARMAMAFENMWKIRLPRNFIILSFENFTLDSRPHSLKFSSFVVRRHGIYRTQPIL